MTARLAFLLLLLAGAPAAATNTAKRVELRVTLHSGKVLKGKLKLKKGKLQVGSRKVRYREVSSIGMVPPPDPKKQAASFARRKARLKADDLKGWERLGRWAKKRWLWAQAREAWHKVVELSADHEEARRGLGQVRGPAGAGWIDGKGLLEERRAKVENTDLNGMVSLAKLGLKVGQRERARGYLVEVLLAEIYHKEALRLLKPFTDRYRQRLSMRLPVAGRWKASEDRSRHHQHKSFAVYALDLSKVDARNRRCKGRGRNLTDHFAFGAPFYAVADGTVVEVREGNPDNPIGRIGNAGGKHNGISIDHGHGEYSWYVHAKKGSIVVKEGQKVRRGQLLGEVGNSGGSALPHLHFTLISYRGISVPWVCEDFNLIAPDDTPLPIERCWPREGWVLEAKEPKPTPPEKK